jgi:hypothetical protein
MTSSNALSNLSNGVGSRASLGRDSHPHSEAVQFSQVSEARRRSAPVGADFFRVKASKAQAASVFNLKKVKDFRVFGSRVVKDTIFEDVEEKAVWFPPASLDDGCIFEVGCCRLILLTEIFF